MLERALGAARDEAEEAVRVASQTYSYQQIAEAADDSRAAVEWLVARHRPYVRRHTEAANERRRVSAAPAEPGLSVSEAAKRMGRSTAMVRRMAGDGKLNAIKGERNNGAWRILGPKPGVTWGDEPAS